MEIKINNNVYKVIFLGSKDERLELENGDYRCGMTDFVKKEIYINKEMCWDSMRYTILHELSHAYIESYGMLQVEFTDEVVCDYIGNYMLNILGDYERIVDYYCNEIEHKK